MSASEHRDANEAADRLAILDLLHRYSTAVTCGDFDRDEELFTPDAVVEIGAPLGIRVQGAGAIRRWRSNAFAALELLVHTTYSPVVRLLGPNRAEATSQAREMVRGSIPTTAGDEEPAPGMNAVFYSVYLDELVKSDGAWKFARRTGRPIYVERGALLGEVYPSRSTPPPT